MRNRGMRGTTYLVTALALALLVVGPAVAAPGPPPGPPGPRACTSANSPTSNVTGDLVAGPGCTLNGVSVSHDVSVAPNGSLTMSGGTIGHDLRIENTSAASSICNVTVVHDVNVNHNSGAVTIGGANCGWASIGNDLHINDNRGGVTVGDASIGQDLVCQNDSPPASVDPTTTTVGHMIVGAECGNVVSKKCPASGCTLKTSDGGTSVTASASGGSAGTLSLAIYPNATSLGSCDTPESEDAASESDDSGTSPVIEVNPPPGASVMLDITFPGYVPGVCKLVDYGEGETQLVELPQCEYTEGAPCWQYTGDSEAGNEVLVYLAPGDPFITGG